MDHDGWERRMLEVFDDLEQQAAGLHLVERDAEVADVAAVEYAAIDLESRLRASRGQTLTLRLRGDLEVSGDLLRVGPEWAMLRAGPDRWLVATAATVCLAGAADRAGHPSTRAVADGVPLRSVLRRLAHDAADAALGGARLHLRDGHRIEGRLGRVGADFVEVRAGDVRTRGPATLVPLAALAAVRWSGW